MERTIVPRDAQKVQHKNYEIIMFPETDEISNIISDTIKVVFKRRLVDRVLRLWTEMARGQGFPSRDQIEPSKLASACGSKPMTARRCCFGMSISTSPLTRCSHGGGTSNCRSAARSTSALAKATITQRGSFFGL